MLKKINKNKAGTLIGGILTYLIIDDKVKSPLLKVGISVLGAYAGASTQNKLKEKNK